MNIGEKIKNLRMSKGITQLQLAKSLNISRGAISQYETGARAINDELKVEIAKLFSISMDFLFGLEENWDGLNIINSPLVQEKSEIQTIYDSLTPGQQQRVLAYMYGFSDANKDFEKLQKKS